MEWALWAFLIVFIAFVLSLPAAIFFKKYDLAYWIAVITLTAISPALSIAILIPDDLGALFHIPSGIIVFVFWLSIFPGLLAGIFVWPLLLAEWCIPKFRVARSIIIAVIVLSYLANLLVLGSAANWS